jgi:transposase
MSTTDNRLNAVSIEGAPEKKGAAYWYEQYQQQREENKRLRTQIHQMSVEIEQLKETLKKLTNRNSQNSSQPPSADAHKKPSKAIKRSKRKQGQKYGHPGTTRNGFERIDQHVELDLDLCQCVGSRWSGLIWYLCVGTKSRNW